MQRLTKRDALAMLEEDLRKLLKSYGAEPLEIENFIIDMENKIDKELEEGNENIIFSNKVKCDKD